MNIHIYLFSIDIYIDLILFFNFIELLRLCFTIFLSLSLISYPLVVFHAQPESRQQKFTNFEWAKEVRLDFSFQACFDFNLVFKAEPITLLTLITLSKIIEFLWEMTFHSWF